MLSGLLLRARLWLRQCRNFHHDHLGYFNSHLSIPQSALQTRRLESGERRGGGGADNDAAAAAANGILPDAGKDSAAQAAEAAWRIAP